VAFPMKKHLNAKLQRRRSSSRRALLLYTSTSAARKLVDDDLVFLLNDARVRGTSRNCQPSPFLRRVRLVGRSGWAGSLGGKPPFASAVWQLEKYAIAAIRSCISAALDSRRYLATYSVRAIWWRAIFDIARAA
jgi:hypothetical protein